MEGNDSGQPARAGEGGGLPKGLSLFRFILFSALLLGALYGGLSLYFNSPPPPGDRPPHGVVAADWEPSAIWFPAFATIKLRVGVAHRIDGYYFATPLGRAVHAGATILLGMALFGLAGWFGGEQIRRNAVARRRY